METVPAQFELPLGVRLLRVYLEHKEHELLLCVAHLSREVFNNIDLTRPERVSIVLYAMYNIKNIESL